MIIYKNDTSNIDAGMLKGFFAGWENFPSPENHLELLKNSGYKILAIDEEKNIVIGFITAVTDEVLTAYIPLLEVLTEYQNRGIGSELVRRMVENLKNFYIIDTVCDNYLSKFYEKAGMKKHSAMIIRNYENQSGRGKS